MAASQDYWIAGCLLLGAGTFLPLVLLHRMPLTENILLRPMLAGMRFGFQYVFTLLSWMTVASLVGTLGREAEAEALNRAKQPQKVQGAAAPRDQRLHGDAEFPLQ